MQQIVWFEFDKHFVLVCENCQRIGDILDGECQECGGKITVFVKEEDSRS